MALHLSLLVLAGHATDAKQACNPEACHVPLHGRFERYPKYTGPALQGVLTAVTACRNRLGVRLLGPRPQFARGDGGEGGSHPANVPDHIYALGTINFTGTHQTADHLSCDRGVHTLQCPIDRNMSPVTLAQQTVWTRWRYLQSIQRGVWQALAAEERNIYCAVPR